jgi:hypothetical protein
MTAAWISHGGERRARGLRGASVAETRASLAVPWVVLVILCFWCGPARPQVVDPNLWVTPGSVSAVVRSGNTLYIAGALGEIGPASGGGVPVSVAGGTPITPFPKVTGYVSSIVPDGEGGWYIAGDFTAVGGAPRNSLAHILADGSLAPWAPRVSDHHIHPIAVEHGIVYMGGLFDSLGGQPRHRLGAVDATTGEVTPWDPNPSGSVLSYVGGPDVLALVVRGDTIFVGGNFTQIGGQPRGGLAAVDAYTGQAFSWNPGSADDYVKALALWNNTLFVGGEFAQFGGQARSLVAAVDVTTGTVTPWNPSVTGPQSNYVVGPYVQTLLVRDNTVYVGGRFDTVGGQPRSALAAVDAATGAVRDWRPDAIYHYSFPWPYVWALAARGDTLYVGGSFDAIGGSEHRYLAAVDTRTGAATEWNPRPNQQVWALAATESGVYVGGSFRTMGSWQIRHCFAAFDLTTGALKDWNPDPNGLVGGSLAVGDGVVYVGGDFTFIGGQPRNRIAALDTLTGAATAWNPAADDIVRTMLLKDGRLYAGGDFWHIGGQPRRYAAAIDTATGLATAWDPNVGDLVFALADRGSMVYLGGFFESVAGEPRGALAAVDAATGALLPWVAAADGPVHALAVDGGTVYAGGEYSAVAGQPRNCLAALDAETGALREWDPGIFGWGVANARPAVHAIAAYGHNLYVGGDFYYIGGQVRPCLAALDDSLGAATGWAPRANFTVLSLAQSGNTLYAGGVFGSMGLLPTAGLAAISLPEDFAPAPVSLALTQSIPNPARSTAIIRFALPVAAPVTLSVYDVQGRRVASLLDHVLQQPGRHDVPVNAGQWRPGVYIYRLEAGGRSATRKMLVVK